MNYEIIDLVDENNIIIGTIERTPEWNANRTTSHRFVDVYVKLSNGRYLMQQRAAHKKGALKFNSPVGGIVTSGLTYEQAAQQELREELGLDDKVKFVTAFKETLGSGEGFAFAEIFEIESDGPFTGWEAEAERLESFTADELNFMTERFPYLFTTGFIKGWSIYRQINNI